MFPAWLPMKRRPPTTAGWEEAIGSFGNPNAHFSLSLGTSAALRPGLVWKCVLLASPPQPDQSPATILSGGAPVVHWPAMGAAAATVENSFPVM